MWERDVLAPSRLILRSCRKPDLMQGNKPSKKKLLFKIKDSLKEYLQTYNRHIELPIKYEDLLHYVASIPLLDIAGTDTLWETVYYSDIEHDEINKSLTKIYALLKTDGDVQVMEHLSVARIDYCTFGNSKPFRIRIINRLNDNYDHFYVKRADASRVYGLELEWLLSPNHVMYLVDGDTLVEEHIAGIPGDEFMAKHLNVSNFNKIRIAKEFVKFNERCFVRLLGDMRSYNFVVDITPDIEGNQYRIRAIDFDQQSYEGRKGFYLPQYFKDNNSIIELGITHVTGNSVIQYQLEERSLIGVRVKASWKQFSELTDIMTKDSISLPEKVNQLKQELAYHHRNQIFLKCKTMGDIVLTNIFLLLRKDFKQSI